MRPNMTMALGGLGLGYVLPGMVLARLAKTPRSTASASSLRRRARPAGGQRRGRPRPRPGDAARRRRSWRSPIPELSDELRLINLELRAGKPRAEALRNLADRTGVDDLELAGHDADPDRQVRHQRRAVAARLLRDAAHQAPAARRGSGGEDRRQDGVPAGVLHLPGDLGRDHRSGGDQVRHGARSR